jgi:hypothetical protein
MRIKVDFGLFVFMDSWSEVLFTLSSFFCTALLHTYPFSECISRRKV